MQFCFRPAELGGEAISRLSTINLSNIHAVPDLRALCIGLVTTVREMRNQRTNYLCRLG